MIRPKHLLDMICTEAFEHSGIPEVPDHKHGAPQNYSAQKRYARGDIPEVVRVASSEEAVLRYYLELLEREDGTLEWVE
ncbi:MAG: hypothetical protein ACKV22_00685 [Bryobacteraceae bacterium]